jgi:hypothetical protein
MNLINNNVNSLYSYIFNVMLLYYYYYYYYYNYLLLKNNNYFSILQQKIIININFCFIIRIRIIK